MENSVREGERVRHEGNITSAVTLAPFIKTTLRRMGYGFLEVNKLPESDGKGIAVGNTVVEVLNHNDFDIRYGKSDLKYTVIGFLERPVDPYDVPEIFIREGPLLNLISVAGHETGHSLSDRLEGDIAEEAKAYAFEKAWGETIAKYNIGGLGDKVLEIMLRAPDPERSPIHYKAHQLVSEWSKRMPALQIHEELKRGSLWAV